MTMYNFTLIISKPKVDDVTAADRLCESGCDDAMFSCSMEEYSLEFSREAESLEEAIESACNDIYSARIGSHVEDIIE